MLTASWYLGRMLFPLMIPDPRGRGKKVQNWKSKKLMTN